MVTQQAKWQRWLNEHDQLVKRTGASVYDRVKVLKRVYDDPAYHAAMKAAAKNPLELINMRVRDTCLPTFSEALAILEMFPRRAQWEANTLYDLREKMLAAKLAEQRKRRDEAAETNGDGTRHVEFDAKDKKDRDTATVAERKNLQAALKEARAEVQRLTELLAEKDKRITDLEETVADLRSVIRPKLAAA